ncbi:MAG: hypothetical protein H0W54_06065 [Rubrobacter sp.]|nr:hypothetical protein [Rubrobacter sp.]
MNRPSGMDGPLVREKAFAGAASLLTVCAVLWPVVQNWREKPKDGFPLSHYPMFSARRSKSASVTYLVGLGAGGGRHPLPYTYAGTGGLNQVRRQINRVVRGGKADTLCRIVAVKVAREERLADVVTVQVVTGRYRLTDYFAGKKDPLSEVVHASCSVERKHRTPLRVVEDLA